MDINFENLGLAQRVLDRQAGHALAIRDHLESYARLSAGDLGLILQLTKPIADAALGVAGGALELSNTVFTTGAERMDATIHAYRDADARAYAAAAALAATLGTSLPPYRPPQTPPLGAPQSEAGAMYGNADGSVFQQAFQDGSSAAEWAIESARDLRGRLDSFGQSRAVAEAVDVRSYLPRPNASEPELEEIRWKAGLIFGAVDWVWEKLMGYSLLEEITKPFAGNWTRMKEASLTWKHAGDALTGISQNTRGMLPAMASWTGRGSEAFSLAAFAVSEGHASLAGPCGTLSTMYTVLVLLSKQVASFILKVLKNLEKKLMRIAAEAAVPLVGWAAALVEAGLSTYELARDVMEAYSMINKIYDVVSALVSGVTGISDSLTRLIDIAETLARGAAARV